MTSISSRKTEHFILATLFLFASLYLAQGVIYWMRLNQIEANIIKLNHRQETCDETNCTAEWTFKAEEHFVLLGHILRTHTLINLANGDEVLPASKVRGTASDSWATLRVYKVEPGLSYSIRATKYKTIKMGYFIGLLPRTTSHQGILSIPDVGPTISTISGLGLAFMLVALFGASLLGSGYSTSEKNRILVKYLVVAAGFALLTTFISLGILDSLLPEGDLRNKILRFSFLLALTIVAFGPILRFEGNHKYFGLLTLVATVLAIGLIFWPWIRAGNTWATIVGLVTVAGSVVLFRNGFKIAAFSWGLTVFDSLKIFGFLNTSDYPPFYFVNVTMFASLAHVAGQTGGYDTLSLAGVAYRRFKRDIVLKYIQEITETIDNRDSMSRISDIKRIIPEISQLTGANRVAITISLPLGRPITHAFDTRNGEVVVFDDGKIPGSVTLRCLVYGDQAIFESFAEFATRARVPKNPNHDDAGFFCALPLRVNQNIVGAMMLTGFDDELIARKKKAGPSHFMTEERETIALLAERLSQSLSKLIVSDMNANAKLSRAIHESMRRAIAAAESSEDFLGDFAESIATVSGLGVMVHERSDNRGIAVAQAGIGTEDWKFFQENPFNLSNTLNPAYGPTVVAFRDDKASYVKDIKEISGKMHPKTVEITDQMGTMSVIAVPLKTLHRSFVVTLMSWRNKGPADPGMLSVLEATESLFVAAVEVMSQKTSVMALGRLASRLIGDDEVRNKILDAAKDPILPTVVGTPRSSFLLLFDLAGSSSFVGDTEEKAKAYGSFYDAVNQKCQEVLGGKVRKTIGDAVIVTWDGTGKSLIELPELLSDLTTVVSYADKIAKAIGCKGSRAILHFGQYFFGLVGTQTFGQIDVIGSGIDEVCKIEGTMKTTRIRNCTLLMAISSTALSNLPQHFIDLLSDSAFVPLKPEGDTKLSICYGLLDTSAETRHVA